MTAKRKTAEKGAVGDDEEQTVASCPSCDGELDVYSGANPIKQGTGFCAACGRRFPVGE